MQKYFRVSIVLLEWVETRQKKMGFKAIFAPIL